LPGNINSLAKMPCKTPLRAFGSGVLLWRKSQKQTRLEIHGLKTRNAVTEKAHSRENLLVILEINQEIREKRWRMFNRQNPAEAGFESYSGSQFSERLLFG
jgi:hypothetical protein